MKPEQITARDVQKKASPHCSHCGSSDIRVEAFALWSEHLQDWRLTELLDGNTACNHCGQGCEIKWTLSN
jgi:predicted molibdopterin-dependent oxidoreductase YjgC